MARKQPEDSGDNDPHGLNPKHRRFVEEYLVDENGTQAAIRAGFTRNADSAKVFASRLLTKANVRRAIEDGRREQLARSDVRQDEVLAEALRVLRFDVRKLFKDDGSMLAPGEMSEDIGRATSTIEVKELTDNHGNVIGYSKKAKGYDKMKAIELLMKKLGLLTDKVQHDMGPSFAELVAASMKKGGDA